MQDRIEPRGLKVYFFSAWAWNNSQICTYFVQILNDFGFFVADDAPHKFPILKVPFMLFACIANALNPFPSESFMEIELIYCD